jgi:hypothetical protein
MPAKVLRYRFEEATIKKLLETKWWDMELSLLIKLHKEMDTPEHFLEALKRNSHEL